MQQIGPANKHGTRITFQADPEIFERNPQFEYERLHRRLRELAYLHPGLVARIHDERTTEMQFDRGISELVESLTWHTRSRLHYDAIRMQAEDTDSQLDIAILFTGAESELIHTYVNSNLLPEGGTPVTGLKKGISRALHHFARKNELTGNVHPTGDDLRRGLTAVIAARVAEPQFVGPLRLKIANPQLDALTDSAVYEYLKKYLADHPDTAERIWKQGLLAARRRTNEEHAMSD
jgi:DNA gyrase subunit B